MMSDPLGRPDPLPIRLLRTEPRVSDAALSVAVHWREPPNETHQVDSPGGRATGRRGGRQGVRLVRLE